MIRFGRTLDMGAEKGQIYSIDSFEGYLYSSDRKLNSNKMESMSENK